MLPKITPARRPLDSIGSARRARPLGDVERELEDRVELGRASMPSISSPPGSNSSRGTNPPRVE